MSEERIVNRVSQPLPAQDGAPQTAAAYRIVSVGKTEVTEPMGEFPNYELAGDPVVPAEATPRDVIDQVVEQAAKDLTDLTVEDIRQMKRQLESATPLQPVITPEKAEEILGSILLARDPDLAAFKKQVIAAFKHLGLDTRQFFGV